MIVETPQALVSAVEAELVRVPLRRQLGALSELHGLFTSARGGLRGLSYLDVPHLRGAYLRYHLPLNVARATCALQQVLRLRPSVRDLEDFADLGAGPGSATLATVLTLPTTPARRSLLQDRSRAGLAAARRLLERCSAPGSLASVKTLAGTIPPLPPLPRRALVWLSMVLNEIEARSRLGFEPDAFLDALAAALDPPSVVVIIEPALRAPGRGLLRLHDAAVASGAWRVVAPCTHQLRCPLLRERDRSWCHFHFEWRAPSLVREVADPLGLDWRSPALAFLALERASEGGPALQMSSPFAGGDRARVIGDLMRVAGGREGIYVCRDGERILMDPVPRGVRRGDVIRGPAGGTERVELAWTPRRRA